MTIKEITAIRKSGKLQEALAAAENEFACNANIYTVGALFWCLNDLAKQQNGNEAASTIERMETLYNDFCQGDNFMQKALATLSRKTQPHFQKLKNAVESAKFGNDIHADYRAIEDYFKAGKLDVSLYSDFGWLIYYALKQTSLTDAQTRKTMLFNYLKLNLPKPSILHSLILVEAIKVEQNTPLLFRIRDFIRLWGLENLRDEDWEQYHTEEGNTLPSSVEKLIRVYTKELKTDGVESPEDFSLLVDKALIKYPKSQNMPYFKASVLISQGKNSEALAYYKDLILRFPSKFYIWEQTAELVENIDTKIGLLCKALSCGADDEFLGGVRLKLSSLLIQKELAPNAKFELEKYRQTYQNKGWNLKSDFWQIYNQLTAVESANTNNETYAEFTIRADEFIYSSLPTALAVKIAETKNEDRNHPGRKIITWILRTENSIIRLRKPTKFQLNKRTPNGTIFDVKLQSDKIVWIKHHIGSISESWLKEHNGEAHIRTDRNGKKYAIISGSYISENLLQGIRDGQEIDVLSILQKDGRWSAVSILKTNNDKDAIK